MLLLGFAGAFRRSELVELNVEDLEETAEGLLITIRRGKTDQEGGQIVRPIWLARTDVSVALRTTSESRRRSSPFQIDQVEGI